MSQETHMLGNNPVLPWISETPYYPLIVVYIYFHIQEDILHLQFTFIFTFKQHFTFWDNSGLRIGNQKW